MRMRIAERIRFMEPRFYCVVQWRIGARACRSLRRIGTGEGAYPPLELLRAPGEPLHEDAEVARIVPEMLLLFVEDFVGVELEDVPGVVRRGVDVVALRHVRFGRSKAIDDRAVERDREHGTRRHQLVRNVEREMQRRLSTARRQLRHGVMSHPTNLVDRAALRT